MNYTKSIREYCQLKPGEILDSKYTHEKYYPMVPYKTYLKILSRLEGEGVLKTVSRGVYQIVGENTPATDEAIIEKYVSNNMGMFIGYKMYNLLGITEHTEQTVEILTTAITGSDKNIGDYHLTKYNGNYLEDDTKAIIEMLEIIENKNNIIGIDISETSKVIEARLKYCKFPLMLGFVFKNRHYKYSTAVFLQEMLNEACIEVDVISKYIKASGDKMT